MAKRPKEVPRKSVAGWCQPGVVGGTGLDAGAAAGAAALAAVAWTMAIWAACICSAAARCSGVISDSSCWTNWSRTPG